MGYADKKGARERLLFVYVKSIGYCSFAKSFLIL